MAALVEVKDICKVYNPGENEVRALDHVSVSIQEKEFVAIIGHSGSGKSTLMNMLGCLDVPTSGSYFLHGKDVSRMSDDELSDVRNREIGFIFQGFNLIANLTALENVELPLIYRGVGKKERRELAEAALEKVGLGQRMSHKPSEMSGGQQQGASERSVSGGSCRGCGGDAFCKRQGGQCGNANLLCAGRHDCAGTQCQRGRRGT